MNINKRNTYSGNFIRDEDFITGIGFDINLLGKLMGKKKNTNFDFYHKDGISIDGTVRIKKYHPLLNKILIDKRAGQKRRKLIIESVHKFWYFGYYWCLVYRIDGSDSHGGFDYKNVNSIDINILNNIKSVENNFEFEDTNLNWEQF